MNGKGGGEVERVKEKSGRNIGEGGEREKRGKGGDGGTVSAKR